MFKLDLPIDKKEAARIARRRVAEEQRKHRIFNPVVRTLGVDCEALRKQVEEKKTREAEERRLNAAHEIEQIRQGLVASQLHNSWELTRKAVKMANSNFNQALACEKSELKQMEKQAQNLGENAYMINQLESEMPSPGSLNVDIEALRMQVEEKKTRDAEERRLNAAHEKEQIRQGLVASQLHNCLELTRKAINKANSNYNLALACEKSELKQLEKRAQNEAEIAHMINQLESEMLSESTDVTSALGPHRVLRDRFRGFSPAQIASIKDDQMRQVFEKRQREEEEKRFDQAWDQQNRRYALIGKMTEYEVAQRRQAVWTKTCKMNMQLAREQSLHQQYLNNILYKDNPTEDYYAQFNTSTR